MGFQKHISCINREPGCLLVEYLAKFGGHISGISNINLQWICAAMTENCCNRNVWVHMKFHVFSFSLLWSQISFQHENTQQYRSFESMAWRKKKKELHWWYSSASPSAYTLLHSVIPTKSQWNRDEMCISSRVGKSAAVVEQQKQLKVHIWYKSLLPCNTEICFLLHLFAVLANVQNV